MAVLCLTAGTAFAVTGFNLFGWHTDTTIVKNPREWQRLYRDATRELTLPPGEHWPDRTLPPDTVTSRTQPGRHRRRHLPDGMGVLLGGRHPPPGTRRRGARPMPRSMTCWRTTSLVAPPGSPENVAPPAGTQAALRDLRLRRRHPVRP